MATSNNKWIKFTKGDLAGLNLYMTEEYSKNYENGNTDYEMIRNMEKDMPLGKTIFDVGAWVGSSSLVFSRLVGSKGTVVSFEPSPYNLERMNKNLKRNTELAKTVKVYQYALSEKNSKTRMFLSQNVDNGHSSTSRISNAHSTIRDEDLPQGFEAVDVETKKLDDFVRETGLKPDIIKVDIEGAEHLFLAGAINTLKEVRPILYIEIHSEYCAIRCYEILSGAGYILTILKEEPDNRIMIKAQYADTDEKMNVKENLLNLQSTQDLILRQIEQLGVLEEKARESEKKDVVIDTLRREAELLQISIDFKIDELEKILNSKSWRITRPMRDLLSFIKKSN